jgi:hypothetical protein
MTAWIVLSALIALPGLGPATRPTKGSTAFRWV